MGDISDGLLAGQKYFQGILDTQRKQRAYNALRQVYGDAAGDPDSAYKLAETGAIPARVGLENAQAGLATASAGAVPSQINQNNAQAGYQTAEANKLRDEQAAKAQLRAAMMLRQVAVGGSTDDVAKAYDEIVTPSAGAWGMSPEDNAKLKQSIVGNGTNGDSQYNNGGRLQTIDNIIAALHQTLDPESTRYGTVIDKNGNVYRYGASGGATPVLGPDGKPVQAYQPEIAQQNIDQRYNLNAPTLKGQQAQAQAQGTAVGKAEGERTASDLPLSKTQRIKAEQDFQSAEQTKDVASHAIDKALSDVGFASAGVLSHLPYNPYAANLQADLNTVTSKVVIDTITEMKKLSATGSTGFGQLSDREGDLIKARLGDVMAAQGPEHLKTALNELKTQLATSWARFKTAYQKDIEARGEAANPNPSAKGGGGGSYNYNPQTGKLEPK